MLTPDLVNGLFEGIGGIFGWLNVYYLYRDKSVKGVNPWFWIFYFMWGFWNLYYYPHLGQSLSFDGGLLIVSSNIVWFSLFIYYRYFAKEKKC